MKWISIFLLAFAQICQANTSFETIKITKDRLSILLSHNIRGELEPCDCQINPMGGIARVGGKIHEIKSGSQVIYVDTGDTFFYFPVGGDKKEGLKVAKGLEMLGLHFLLPGDYDFAAGTKFLRDVAKKKINLLISNLKDKTFLPHKEWAVIQKRGVKIFLVGIVEPSLLPSSVRAKFSPPDKALKQVLMKIKKHGFNSKNKNHRLIALSHSGLEKDIKIAKKFPQIDWILGAHTMSDLREPEVQGKTRIVQVEYNNRVLGEVEFVFKNGKIIDKWKTHDITAGLEKKLPPKARQALLDLTK